MNSILQEYSEYTETDKLFLKNFIQELILVHKNIEENKEKNRLIRKRLMIIQTLQVVY